MNNNEKETIENTPTATVELDELTIDAEDLAAITGGATPLRSVDLGRFDVTKFRPVTPALRDRTGSAASYISVSSVVSSDRRFDKNVLFNAQQVLATRGV